MSSQPPLDLSRYSWTENVLPIYPSGMFGKTCTAITEPPPRAPVHFPTVKEFTLRDLPKVMENVLKWPVSAAVMKLWFSLPARALSNKEKDGDVKPREIPRDYVNTDLITWAWLNRFERVQKAEAELMAKLNTANALRALDGLITSKTKQAFVEAGGKPAEIRNNFQNPIDLHSDWQFQFVKVGYQMNQVDDLYGALGNFILAAAVTKASLTQLRPGVAKLMIREVGIYVRDTFDFIGQQYLGHWSDKGLALQPFAVASNMAGNADIDMPTWHMPAWNPRMGWLKPVNNSDFRTLRNATQRGGDLVLFSDVRLKPVNLNIEIKL